MNRNGIHSQTRILSALERGPLSSRELTERVHMSTTNIEKHIRKLIEQRLMHLHGYRRSERGPFTRVYALGRGDGHVVNELIPLQPAWRCKEWRQRGGDSHKTRRLQKNSAKISAAMTLAGMLGA
jgi:predicted ArsR family transcriptional regulator